MKNKREILRHAIRLVESLIFALTIVALPVLTACAICLHWHPYAITLFIMAAGVEFGLVWCAAFDSLVDK